MIRRLVSAVLVLALTGCGFHLRERVAIPTELSPLRVVSADRYSPLAESIAQSVERAGLTVIREGGNGAVLDILAEQWGDTPISVDALGRSQEFSLRYAVIFELRDSGGNVVVPRQTIELARDYVSNPTNAIGSEGERETLAKELRREMAFSMLRRIEAVLKLGGPIKPLQPVPAPTITPNPADQTGARSGG
ncbi:LPS-assembly lipoprotein LptE [Lysobacter claricitrinus]|uniref:LPS-assembly lipoprotein LptE n=1 Tax=Lysobacter claricitrinus TaxID=3367728 RepID=UPI0038B2D96D